MEQRDLCKAVAIPDSLDDLIIGKEIGFGSTSTVHLAYLTRSRCNPVPSHPWAIKAISLRRRWTERENARLLSEESLLEEICHPCIVKCHKTYTDEDNIYHLMELMSRGTVLEHIRVEPTVKLAQVKYYAAVAVLALEHLNRHSILFRDLKLTNMLVNSNGQAKLVDFGMSKRLSVEGRTHTICGTRHYLPPEALEGDDGDDQQSSGYFCLASDRWGLGVFLFELLARRPPFDYGVPQRELCAAILSVPGSLPPPPWGGGFCAESEALVRALLQRNPRDRPSYDGIMAHPWFADVDFAEILTGQATLSGHLPPELPLEPLDFGDDEERSDSGSSGSEGVSSTGVSHQVDADDTSGDIMSRADYRDSNQTDSEESGKVGRDHTGMALAATQAAQSALCGNSENESINDDMFRGF